MKNIVLLAGLTALMMSSCEVKEKVSSSNGEPFGMNIACADFGSVFPGEYNKDYTYPTDSDLVYWEKKGLKLVRMPFKWERLQYKLDGGLNKHDLEKMK